MDDRYFTEEMSYLLEQGKEFSRLHPQKARMLHLDDTRSRDPNVERLLESFAFLTSRIRKKLDDDFSHVADGLLSLVWPDGLNPIPSFSFLEFRHLQTDSGSIIHVPAGAEIDSMPLKNGLRCRFRTCYGTSVFPIEVSRAVVESSGSNFKFTLSLSMSGPGEIEDLAAHKLRFQLWGEVFNCWQLYNLLLGKKGKSDNVQSVEVVVFDESKNRIGSKVFSTDHIHPVGFRKEESLLPPPKTSLWSFGLIRDFFAFPEKFQGFELDVLSAVAAHPNARSFDIVFEVDAAWPVNLRVDEKHFRLNTVPIVNLFSRDAEPIRLDHLHHRYTVRGDITNPEFYEVHSVDSVQSIEVGSGKRTTYEPLFSCHSRANSQDLSYYSLDREPASWGGVECYISFNGAKTQEAFPKSQFASLTLTCTNGRFAHQILPNQITDAVSGIDSALSLSNISHPTNYLPSSREQSSIWKWVSHVSMNFLSLCSVEQLKSLLRLYDSSETNERSYKIDGITDVFLTPIRRLHKGIIMPGNAIEIVVKETHFAEVGEIDLFARVLSAFFSSFASINSYVQLTLRAQPSGRTMTLSPRLGENQQL